MHLWWELSVQPSIYILKGSTPIASPSHYYIITMSPNIKCPLTSTCIQQLCSLDETQVTGPGPQSLGLPKAEPGVEVVCLQALLPINGVVATGIVWAVHPNLHKKKKKKRLSELLWLLNFDKKREIWLKINIKEIFSLSPSFTPCQWNRTVCGTCLRTHLTKMRVPQWASGLWVDYDDSHSW